MGIVSDDLTRIVGKVLEGFDEGYFVRGTQNDHESDWAIKVLPYLQALGKLKEWHDAQ